jgi:hypothetical protein
LENYFGTSYLKCKYVVIGNHNIDLIHTRECNINFRSFPLGVILIHVRFLHERERTVPHNDTVSCESYIQGVSRLVDITAGGDFLGLCDQKSSYKHVSDFGRLRSYGHFLIPYTPSCKPHLTEPADW